jgi:ABC-type thiamine transport system ATPase subunit
MTIPDLMTVERAQEAFLRLYERARGGKRDRAPWRSRIEEEVALALDPAMKGEVLDVMKELAQAGMTMLVVTHENKFAQDVATRVWEMQGGLIEKDGRASEILASHF